MLRKMIWAAEPYTCAEMRMHTEAAAISVVFSIQYHVWKKPNERVSGVVQGRRSLCGLCHSYLTSLSLGFGRKQHDMKGFSSGFQSIGKRDADLSVACGATASLLLFRFSAIWVTYWVT